EGLKDAAGPDPVGLGQPDEAPRLRVNLKATRGPPDVADTRLRGSDDQRAKSLERSAPEILPVALVLPADEHARVELHALEDAFLLVADDFGAAVDLQKEECRRVTPLQREDRVRRVTDFGRRVGHVTDHVADVLPDRAPAVSFTDVFRDEAAQPDVRVFRRLRERDAKVTHLQEVPQEVIVLRLVTGPRPSQLADLHAELRRHRLRALALQIEYPLGDVRHGEARQVPGFGERPQSPPRGLKGREVQPPDLRGRKIPILVDVAGHGQIAPGQAGSLHTHRFQCLLQLSKTLPGSRSSSTLAARRAGTCAGDADRAASVTGSSL